MTIDKDLKHWSAEYVGHDTVVMPPNWRNEGTVTYTFFFTKSELQKEKHVEFYAICKKHDIVNPRLFTPELLRFSSLLHPSFFHSLKTKKHHLQSYTDTLVPFKIQRTTSNVVPVDSVRYYLQSLLFLTGVTLSAAIIQNRWSYGTIESKLNRLWQAGKIAETSALDDLAALNICEFVLQIAEKRFTNPLECLFELKFFFSKILNVLFKEVKMEMRTLTPTPLNDAQIQRFGFVDQLKEVLKDNLQAIILYGSATNSEQFSDYDLIIIVKDLKAGLEVMAEKSPEYNGIELNISLFDKTDFTTYQLASGDNLMDHALCLYGEAQVPHKPENDLLARNFSFGFIRFRQQMGMAAHVNKNDQLEDSKVNLYNYFIKIPLNVSKGIMGCSGSVTNNELLKSWFIDQMAFDVEALKEKSLHGNHAEAIAIASWATCEVMKYYNKKLALFI